MKKNLIYYSVGHRDDYAEMLKLSLESLDYSNPNLLDVLIITDTDFYTRNFSDLQRPQTTFLLLPEIVNSDQSCFNRLRIFEFPQVFNYENIIYLDADTLVNVDLNDIFDKCNQDNCLYVNVEEPSMENHRRIQFSLGNYTEEEIEFFVNKNIQTFNSGTYIFKPSILMKKHFENVLKLVEGHVGEYFTDQSFLNYYFNSYNLTNTSVLIKEENYRYIVDSNFYERHDLKNKIFHFINESEALIPKIDKIKEFKNFILTNKSYSDRIEFVKDLNKFIKNGKGVEVGVFQGEFSKEILQNWGGTLYMIDVWRPLGEEYIDNSNIANYPDAYKNTMENIIGYEDRGIMIRASSKVASEIFEDESLDFIYIDANHSYEFVVEDLNLWFPKLKKGGIFSGHDYVSMNWYEDPNFLENKKDKHMYTKFDDGTSIYHGIFGVNPAVDEFCHKHGYKLNKTEEWYSSWWIIK